jgi:hypothetical protein
MVTLGWCPAALVRISSIGFREHSGNIQGTFREHSGNIQGTLRARTLRDHSGNIQGPLRAHGHLGLVLSCLGEHFQRTLPHLRPLRILQPLKHLSSACHKLHKCNPHTSRSMPRA